MRQRILWRMICAGALLGSLSAALVVGTSESSGAAVLAAFTLVLVAASLWVILESHPEGRRWFAHGAGCGLTASAILMLMCGPEILAYHLLGKFSRSELEPVLYSGIGSAVLTAWLALLCGIAGGALAILRSRRAGVPVGLMLFLLIAGFLWLRTLAAHEPPLPDAIEQKGAKRGRESFIPRQAQHLEQPFHSPVVKTR